MITISWLFITQISCTWGFWCWCHTCSWSHEIHTTVCHVSSVSLSSTLKLLCSPESAGWILLSRQLNSSLWHSDGGLLKTDSHSYSCDTVHIRNLQEPVRLHFEELIQKVEFVVKWKLHNVDMYKYTVSRWLSPIQSLNKCEIRSQSLLLVRSYGVE